MKILKIKGKITNSEAHDVENQAGEEQQRLIEAEIESRGKSGFKLKNHPPEDDCCAICFGPFNVPSRTNCGHWFCSECFLQYWHHSEGTEGCTCPFCSTIVTKLIPHAPLLVQPGDRVQKILKQVENYNHLNIVGYLDVFWRALAMALLLRRRFLELDPDVAYQLVKLIGLVISAIGVLMASIYLVCDFDFIPYGGLMIIMCCQAFSQILVTAIYADRIYYAHRRELHARLLAQQGVLNQLE